MKSRSFVRRALAGTVGVLCIFALQAPASAGIADDALLAESADVQFTTPTISVVVPELDGGPTTCTYDLTGSGRISRAAGSSVMSERGTVKGTTNCSRTLTAVLTITDSAVGGSTERVGCLGSGLRSAGCSSSQSVAYFTSGVVTRPASTVFFRYQLFSGNQERLCFEHKITVVGATQGAHGTGPCGASAV
ncbi:MAG TPA: hypothetical protein VEU29_01640 [Actinomycetota bacterium]|nr:hypothetical protein [Actinomycetota bacterium]